MVLNKSKFLSDNYVKNLLSTGRWTDHGSDLNEWLEDCEEVPEAYQGGDIFDLSSDEKFIRFFKDYLSARFDYAMNYLSKDLVGEGPLRLNRAMLVTQDFIENLKIGELYDFGQYWATQHTIPYGAEPDEQKQELFLVCQVERNQVDIEKTMKSRMDYIHGDYEMEIQTKTKEKVKLLSFD
jgi:polyhydroxyalkanoate synthesis regulator phasin